MNRNNLNDFNPMPVLISVLLTLGLQLAKSVDNSTSVNAETTTETAEITIAESVDLKASRIVEKIVVTTTETTTEIVTTTEPEPIDEVQLYLEEFNYIPMTEKLKLHIKDLCDYYDFDPRTIYQLIYSESRYQPTADSGICQGLMQISRDEDDLRFFAEIEDIYEVTYPCNLCDPYVNTTLGIRVLSRWRDVAGEGSTMSDWINYYGWGYDYDGNSSSILYGNYVQSINLESVDFSEYEIVG